MDWTRREVLAGMAGVLAAPVPGRASALESALDAERLALLAEVREKALGFDVAAAVRNAMAQLGIARKFVEQVDAVLAPLGLTRGLHSVSDLFELEGEPLKALEAIAARMQRSLRVKLAVRGKLKAAPRTPEARQALLERTIEGLLGIDLDRIRAHVAQYPSQDMVIVIAPVTRVSELVGLIGWEPFALYLQMAHATRARVLFCEGADALEQVVRVFVDPAVRRIALVGHGHWDSYSLAGWRIGPDEAFERLCTMAATRPKDLASLQERQVFKVVGGAYWREALAEPELAALAAQLYPGGDVPFKDLVVRYTCGTRRYTTEATLLWLLLPESFEEAVDMREGGFAPRHPGQDEVWVDEMAAWLADKDVPIVEAPALGTSFVANPQDTRGYDGLSWIDDFVADPIPEWLPPHRFDTPGTADQE